VRARGSTGLATSILALALACGGAEVSEPATSARPVEPPCEGVEEPDRAELIALLEAHRFEALDAAFRRLQEVLETNKACELRAWRGLSTFRSSSSALMPHLDAWVDAMPETWASHAARAGYWRTVGFARRGTRFANETPQEAFAGMREAFSHALADLGRAIELEPRHLPASLDAIAIASANSDREGRERSLAAALEVDPASFAFLDDAMQWYDPAWGGSVKEIRRIADAAQRHLDANPRLVRLLGVAKYLEARLLARAGKDGEAIERFEQALAIYPGHRSVGELFALLYDRRQHERMIQNANRVDEWWLERGGQTTGWVLAYRGIAYWKIGNLKRARADLERAAERDPLNSWVQTQWAWFVEGTEGAAVALPHYERAWALRRSDAWLAERVAHALQAHPARRAEALPVLHRLTELAPEEAGNWLAYGTLLHEFGDADARGALERYLALADPGDPLTQGRNQAVARMLAGEGAESPDSQAAATALPALARVTALVEARRSAGLSAGTR
jgi:tetratricopeptide (TPR) repeat protein